MRKHPALSFATSWVLLAVTGACASNEATPPPPDGSPPEPDAGVDSPGDMPADSGSPADTGSPDGSSDVQPPTTIRYLRADNPRFAAADDAFWSDHADDNPTLRVEVTTIRQPALTATLMAELTHDRLEYDLVMVPPSWVCGFADNLQDVPAEVVTLSEAQNTFFAAPLAGSVCGGKLKGLPVEYNLEYGGVVVNMTKYQAKFGAGRTPDWASWSGFITEAAQLTEYDGELNPKANGLDIDPSWPQPTKHIFLSQILQRGGVYWDGGGDGFDAGRGHTFNFTSAEAVASLTEMVKWVATDKVMFPAELVDSVNTFVTVRLAYGHSGYGWRDPAKPLSVMGYVGTWAVANTLAQLPSGNPTRYDFHALPPMVGGEHRFVQNSGFALVVPRTSRNPAAAWAAARALTLSPEAMRKWGAIAGALPALKVNGTPEAASGDPLLARVQRLLVKGRWVGYIPPPSLDAIDATLVSNYFAAIKGPGNGGKTIAQALADMQAAANAELARYR